MEHKFEKAKKFFTEIKKTVYLWKNQWKECTTALMRSPRSEDKTAVALAIASEIADSGREVLYVNAEQRLDNCPAVDSDNLYVFTPEYSSPDDTTDYADLVFEAIEQAVATTAIRTFVVDSISRMAALSFGRNASVAYLMKRLVALQVKHRLSVLVLADDSTKTVNNALTALAASELSQNSENSDNSDSSDPSDPSDPSDEQTSIPTSSAYENRESCIVNCASKSLSRRERRAMQRRTTPRFDRFAGPHMKFRG